MDRVQGCGRYPIRYFVEYRDRSVIFLKFSITRLVLTVAQFLYRGFSCIGVDVTRASAIAEFANRVEGLGIFVLFVRTCFIVVGMATGAGTRIGLRGIRNVCVIVVVTRTTAYVAIVVARIVTITWMRVIDWRPGLRGMTVITFRYGNEMIIWTLWCAADRNSTVVTRPAITANPLVIPHAANEGCGGMTEGAIQAGRYMIR